MNLKLLSLISLSTVLLCACSSHNLDNHIAKQSYIHQYGSTLSKGDWIERGGNGQRVTIQTDGITIKEQFKNELLDGESTFSFPHSSVIKSTRVYQNGIVVSETSNFSNGLPQSRTQYDPNHSERRTTWYHTGSPKTVEVFSNGLLSSGEYFTINNDLESSVADGVGILTDRDIGGQLLSINEVNEGSVTLKTEFYSNGSPKTLSPFMNGEIHGTVKHYSMDGVPERFEHWVSGTQEGLTVFFHNGEKLRELPYIKGIVDGTERHYINGSTVVKTIQWSKNKKHGPASFYIDGKAKTDWYYDNRLVTQSLFEKLTNIR